MEYHGGPRKTTIYYGLTLRTTGDHGEIRMQKKKFRLDTMGGHGVLRGNTGHGVPRKTTIYYGGTRHTTGDHGEILLIFALSFDFYKKRKKIFGSILWGDTAYYGGPRGMEYHGGPRKTTIYYGGTRHTTGDHGEILLIFALSFNFYKKRKKNFGSILWGDTAYYGGPRSMEYPFLTSDFTYSQYSQI